MQFFGLEGKSSRVLIVDACEAVKLARFTLFSVEIDVLTSIIVMPVQAKDRDKSVAGVYTSCKSPSQLGSHRAKTGS